MPRTNGERTKDRIESDSASLIARIHSAIKSYGETYFGEPLKVYELGFAVRDALIEIRHICDAYELDYGAMDKAAYQVYLEEVAHGQADESDDEQPDGRCTNCGCDLHGGRCPEGCEGNGPLSGKHYRTRFQDMEEDDAYGEVLHPIGSTFTVGKLLSGYGEPHYAILWEQAIVAATGEVVPPKACEGMWTCWTPEEIAKQADEILGAELATEPAPGVVSSYCLTLTPKQRDALGRAADWAYVDISDGVPYLDEEYEAADLSAQAKEFLILGEVMETHLGFHGEISRWTELAARYDAAAAKKETNDAT
jgi:hypothetical protein